MKQPNSTEATVIQYLDKMFQRQRPWESPVWQWLRQNKRLKLHKVGGQKTDKKFNRA